MPSHAKPLSRQQVRAVDQRAVEELGLSGVVLMENAGAHVAQAVREILHDQGPTPDRPPRVAILCGGGNNGGDGYVVARHLAIHDIGVAIFALKNPATLTGDAAVHANVAVRLGMPVRQVEGQTPGSEQIDELCRDFDVIVDAILGTGFDALVNPKVRQPTASWITAINRARQGGTAVVAVDLPSGLDCDTGRPADPTVFATATVTFVAPKTGFLSAGAQEHLGRVIVADIGVPQSWVEGQ